MRKLRSYSWPGNIRELQSVLKRALLGATGRVLIPEFLPESLGDSRDPAPPTPEASEAMARLESLIQDRLLGGGGELYQEAHLQLDRFLLPLVLRATEGNQLQAARILGVARQTLRLRIRELGLTITRSIEGAEDTAE
jgi:two-component system nitrogen regulation response regulator GlnG